MLVRIPTVKASRWSCILQQDDNERKLFFLANQVTLISHVILNVCKLKDMLYG